MTPKPPKFPGSVEANARKRPNREQEDIQLSFSFPKEKAKAYSIKDPQSYSRSEMEKEREISHPSNKKQAEDGRHLKSRHGNSREKVAHTTPRSRPQPSSLSTSHRKHLDSFSLSQPKTPEKDLIMELESSSGSIASKDTVILHHGSSGKSTDTTASMDTPSIDNAPKLGAHTLKKKASSREAKSSESTVQVIQASNAAKRKKVKQIQVVSLSELSWLDTSKCSFRIESDPSEHLPKFLESNASKERSVEHNSQSLKEKRLPLRDSQANKRRRSSVHSDVSGEPVARDPRKSTTTTRPLNAPERSSDTQLVSKSSVKKQDASTTEGTNPSQVIPDSTISGRKNQQRSIGEPSSKDQASLRHSIHTDSTATSFPAPVKHEATAALRAPSTSSSPDQPVIATTKAEHHGDSSPPINTLTLTDESVDDEAKALIQERRTEKVAKSFPPNETLSLTGKTINGQAKTVVEKEQNSKIAEISPPTEALSFADKAVDDDTESLLEEEMIDKITETSLSICLPSLAELSKIVNSVNVVRVSRKRKPILHSTSVKVKRGISYEEWCEFGKTHYFRPTTGRIVSFWDLYQESPPSDMQQMNTQFKSRSTNYKQLRRFFGWVNAKRSKLPKEV
mmetsp:Transcript_14782/g.26461  ORF Transcript_14782/g.26461 Transcript_14782/m.26461 type:complete len:622 (-) Transcript_14782:828-2693(-)